MQIIAHRGDSGIEPENTIRSLKRVKESGVNFVEFDIRRSKDGELVVFHDFTLKRLFGINKLISNLTLSELREISVGREIPTLYEALSAIDCNVNLDIKVYGSEKEILEKIKDFPFKVLITSWNPWVLKKIRTLDRNISLGPIVGYKFRIFLPIVVALLKRQNVSSITIKKEFITEQMVTGFHNRGWKVLAFTVNGELEFQRLKNLGIDGVFTDYPELIIKYDQDRSL